MSGKSCQACSWCFPLCCCTGPQVHVPLAILAALMVLSAIGTLDDLQASAAFWTFLGTEAEIAIWGLAVLNLIAPLTFIISLFQCITPPMKRILVFIFFIYLLIDAILIGIAAIVFVILAITVDTADCEIGVDTDTDSSTDTTVDVSGWCDIIAFLLWLFAISFGLMTLLHVNWAGATWYHYSNNLDQDAIRNPQTTSGQTHTTHV